MYQFNLYYLKVSINKRYKKNKAKHEEKCNISNYEFLFSFFNLGLIYLLDIYINKK